MPLSDAVVHTAFHEYIQANKKEKRARCRYCNYELAKYTSRQRTHLIKCRAYLTAMKDGHQKNSITQRAAGVEDKSQSPLFQTEISPEKRQKLEKLAAMAVYYGGKPLSYYEDDGSQDLWIQGIGWKPPSRDKLSGNLLDDAFLETKAKVDKLLNESSLLNFISDESNNQPGDRILNMCAMMKTQSFHIHSESAKEISLSAPNTASWMLKVIDTTVDGDFKRVNSITTDTCNLERAVWDILAQDYRLRHVFFIPCDSHGLQLLIKDILTMPTIRVCFLKALKIVNSIRKAKRQLGLLRKYQLLHYGKKKALIASTILRWGTQVNLLQSLLNSKSALRAYAYDEHAAFKNRRNKPPNRTLEYLQDPEFWTQLDELVAILRPIHEAQKMSESNHSTLDGIYTRWIDIERELRAQASHNKFGDDIQAFLLLYLGLD